ncbi:hypothetical protein YC2023_024960 [Brassica napus]
MLFSEGLLRCGEESIGVPVCRSLVSCFGFWNGWCSKEMVVWHCRRVLSGVWSSHPCGFRVHLKVVAQLLWLSQTGLFCGLEACLENDHPSVRDSSWMVWQIVLCFLLQV